MTNDNTTGYGTEVCAMITMPAIDSATLSSVEWYCEFWTTGKKVRVTKNEAHKENDNSYACYVDSGKTGRGALWGQLSVLVPDSRCADGYRKEVSEPFPIMSSEDGAKQIYIV